MPVVCLALSYALVWICDYEFLLYSQNPVTECICQKDKEPTETTHKRKWENWTSGHFYRKWDHMARAVILAEVLGPRRPIWRETVVLCACETLIPPSPGTTSPRVERTCWGKEDKLSSKFTVPRGCFWWIWRELLLESDIYKGRLIICPRSSTCRHVNQKDHRCSKHVKGVEPNVTNYGDPQMDHPYSAWKPAGRNNASWPLLSHSFNKYPSKPYSVSQAIGEALYLWTKKTGKDCLHGAYFLLGDR